MRGQRRGRRQDNNGDTLIDSSKILNANIQQSEWKFRRGGIVNNKMTMKAQTTR